jgi:hypothetical protein
MDPAVVWVSETTQLLPLDRYHCQSTNTSWTPPYEIRNHSSDIIDHLPTTNFKKYNTRLSHVMNLLESSFFLIGFQNYIFYAARSYTESCPLC